MAVPNTTTFTLQDVVDEINPTTDDLVDCFADANASGFDATYEGSKNQLLNFRNYSHITTEGPNFPSSSTSVSDSGEAWINVSRIESDSGGDASSSSSCFILASGSSDLLRGTTFGFSASSAPVGIEVVIHRSPSAGASGDVDDNSIQLVLSGSTLGTAKTDGIWADGYNEITFGGPTDLWGATPSASDVNNTTFGVQLKADNIDGINGANTFVESFTIKLYF